MLGRLLENELRSSDERPRIRLAGQSMRHCERRVRDALGSVDDELRPDPDARSASRTQRAIESRGRWRCVTTMRHLSHVPSAGTNIPLRVIGRHAKWMTRRLASATDVARHHA